MKRLILILTMLGSWLSALGGTAAAETLPLKKVLVVHSYHETQQGHVVEMNTGIRQAFSGAPADLRYVYMDTKRKPCTPCKEAAGIAALDVMKAFGPDVVIAMDDNAQAFFVTRAMTLAGAPDFVFGGVNADPGIYGYPRNNVTGVLERPNIRESLDLLLKIRPGVRRVLMISDKSRTTDLFVRYAGTLELPVSVAGYAQPETLPDFRALIDTYKDRVDAFGLYVLRTVRRTAAGNDMVPEKELMAVLSQRSDLPTVGFFDSAAEAGVLCGISVSMVEQGYEAGRIARAILDGRSPRDFPMAPTRRGRIQLNLVQAERLNIDIPWKIISKADVVVR